MSTITQILAKKILNSRGDWTIEVSATSSKGTSVLASVPEGKSKGSYEVKTVLADKAVELINEVLRENLIGRDVTDQSGLDAFLCEKDGTPDKSILGGNTTLGISLAVVRLAAFEKNIPLWKYIRGLLGDLFISKSALKIFANVINGGVHAPGGPRFQEYMLIPNGGSFSFQIENIIKTYKALQDIISLNYGEAGVHLGDEGGFSIPKGDDTIPLSLMKKALESAGLFSSFAFGIDVAANEVKEKKEELLRVYKELLSTYPVQYWEDPFAENDIDAFIALMKILPSGALLAGDDLTVSNANRIDDAGAQKAINAVIIKPNQIGTISESLTSVRKAKERGLFVIASHRSGETNDNFIADFAVGVGAFGVKIGAPSRVERIAKYDRLLAIEKEGIEG